MPEYVVEIANLDSAIDSYVELSEANLPESASNRRSRYQWYYRDNPEGRGNFFLLSCENDDQQKSQIVGCVGLAPRRLRYQGEWLRAGLSADFAVNRAHRTVRPALTLQRAADTFGRSHYDLMYGFPNAAAVGVFVRVGYKVIGYMGRWVKGLRFGPLVHRRVPMWPVSAGAGVVLDTVERAREWIKIKQIPSFLRFEWIGDFDARFDRFWNRSPPVSGLSGHRSREWMRWRFSAYASAGLRIGAVINSNTNEVCAYAIVAPKEPTVARIGDFDAAGPAELGALLAFLSPRLRELGFHSASIQLLGPPWIRKVLERHNYNFRGADRAVIARLASHVSAAGPPVAEECYLTTADTDT
jgi:hypothetical protein